LKEFYTGTETSILNICQNAKLSPNFAQFQIAEEKDKQLVSLSVLNSCKDKFLESKEKKFVLPVVVLASTMIWSTGIEWKNASILRRRKRRRQSFSKTLFKPE